MRLLFAIATKHLLSRRRQSLVSVLGIVLGVAFFLMISALMQGSQRDFVKRLIDNSPHITIVDEFRNPRTQPLAERNPVGALEIRNVKPITETRGIRGFEQILSYLRSISDLRAAPVLEGQALVNFAGRDFAVTLNGMTPQDVKGVTTIENYIKEGSIDALIADPDGIVIGSELARTLALSLRDNITVAATTGQVRMFKILGIFRTGRIDYDTRQVFADLKRVQALLSRPNRANSIIIKLADPALAHAIAAKLESRVVYKTISWQERSEDILNTLTVRNIIMYSVVSAVLLVAAFGIYNVISTVVMEKRRDIAILKSIGFYASDIQRIFLLEGLLVGSIGCLLGLPFGALLMSLLMQVELTVPGSSERIHMPLDWGWPQFAIAAFFAMAAATSAAWVPARKAAGLQPVDILRGGM